MPKMNGYELIQELRSRPETMKLPIIMFTGATNRHHLKTLNLDISDFLEKPVPNGRLLQSVENILGALPPLRAAALVTAAPGLRQAGGDRKSVV